MAEPARAWIFQANPKFFDVEGALRASPEISWVVRRHRDDIRAGDRVFFWLTGGGGVLATGTVLTDPAVMGVDPRNEPFYVNASEFAEPEMRVAVRVDRILDDPITKEQALSHEVLRDLSVIRAPTGTNFAVTPPQHAALCELVERGGDRRPRSGDDIWARTARLCAAILADRRSFEEHEILYKRVIAGRAAQAITAAREGRPLAEPIQEVFRSTPYSRNNLVDFRVVDNFKRWVGEDERAVRSGLVALAAEEAVADRVDRFASHLPTETLGQRAAQLGLASVFLLGVDISRFPVFRATALRNAETILGWPATPSRATAGQEYQHHIDFLRHFQSRLRDHGVEVADMLEAQSLVWILMNYGNPEYVAWRGGQEVREAGGDGRSGGLDALADELFVPPSFLHEVVDALRAKHQIVFYGPPGTGKTFIARRLAEHLAGDPGRLQKVQFHPSYSYEDFIQGYRPRTGPDGSLSYALVDGPLKRLADSASRSDDLHVLLIDEINRGNLPRIFGELLYLLEYRDEAVSLMYAQDGSLFSIPSNLWVIATMNTADRSIGLIDAALRRRFHFKALFPDREPVSHVLRRWLHENVQSMAHVADDVDRLNRLLRERFGDHLQIGHSHFMDERLDETRLRMIWELDVMPLLEDQLFGREHELRAFTLDALRRSPGPDGDADDQTDRAPADG